MHVSEDVKFSIERIDDKDITFVKRKADSINVENATDADSVEKKARLFLRNKFRGIVLPVGNTKSAYIRSEAINEYTNPAKELDSKNYHGKMLAATELDNLLKSSKYLSWKQDDGRHPEVIRWINYETVFLVDDGDGNEQVLKGNVCIKRIARGDCFYDITKIENITNGNMGQSILKHAAQSESDVSNNSIPDFSEKVNTSDEKIQFSREVNDVNSKNNITMTRGEAKKRDANYNRWR